LREIENYDSRQDFDMFEEMIVMMEELLEDRKNTALTFDELCSFQDLDGSFKLFDSCQVPVDVQVDFCLTPTYLGMRFTTGIYTYIWAN
jgi:hypothetical protein